MEATAVETGECWDTRGKVLSKGRCSGLRLQATKPVFTQPPLTQKASYEEIIVKFVTVMLK